jgi:hypothetical protein
LTRVQNDDRYSYFLKGYQSIQVEEKWENISSCENEKEIDERLRVRETYNANEVIYVGKVNVEILRKRMKKRI